MSCGDERLDHDRSAWWARVGHGRVGRRECAGHAVRNEARDVDPSASRRKRAERCFGTVRPVRRDGEGGTHDGAALRGRMGRESVGGEPVMRDARCGAGGLRLRLKERSVSA